MESEKNRKGFGSLGFANVFPTFHSRQRAPKYTSPFPPVVVFSEVFFWGATRCLAKFHDMNRYESIIFGSLLNTLSFLSDLSCGMILSSV